MTIVPPRGRLFTAVEAAQYLGVNVTRIRRFVAARAFPVLRDEHGRLQGIYQAELDAWQARSTQPAATAAMASAGTMAVDQRMEQLIRSMEAGR